MNYYYLDLNDDDTTDFKIGARFFLHDDGPHPPYEGYIVTIISIDQNGINIGPIDENSTIDSNLSFEQMDNIYGTIQGMGNVGIWPYLLDNPQTYGYIALKLVAEGNTYYGWVKMKTDGRSFTIDSYAYNTTPGHPISAGQTE